MIIDYVLKYIGYFAAFCTTIAFFPQAIKAWKTKSTKDISLYMFLLLVVGSFVMGSLRNTNFKFTTCNC